MLGFLCALSYVHTSRILHHATCLLRPLIESVSHIALLSHYFCRVAICLVFEQCFHGGCCRNGVKRCQHLQCRHTFVGMHDHTGCTVTLMFVAVCRPSLLQVPIIEPHKHKCTEGRFLHWHDCACDETKHARRGG